MKARVQMAALATTALALSCLTFQLGRASVSTPASHSRPEAVVPARDASAAAAAAPVSALSIAQQRGTVRNIATVPFSELYDILREATPEQLLGWAAELE